MTALTISAQFVAVFLAAFLAFGLENMRERRRMARWVREHLRHVQELNRSEIAQRDQVREVLRSYAGSLERWLAADKPQDMSEEDWDRLTAAFSSRAPEMDSLLRSEAVTVLPQDLALALARLESDSQTMAMVSEGLRRAHDDMVPMVHERRVPLSPPDVSRVRRVQRSYAQYAALAERNFVALDEAMAALERWR